MVWGVKQQIQQLQKLLVPGVIGNYRTFEVTEVVAFQRNVPLTNFLTLLVAEPSVTLVDPGADASFMNDAPIKFPETKWKFGVTRYRISPADALAALEQFDRSGTWRLGNRDLKVGKLAALPPLFVPADSSDRNPWNGVLKNNFWDGSHILELFDQSKEDFQFLLAQPRRLADLAGVLRRYVPLGLDGLSDRLGSVLIQLPITVAVTRMRGSETGSSLHQPVWHPGTPPRPLRVSWESYRDATIERFASKTVHEDLADFALHSQRGDARYVAWDDEHELILGASPRVGFITGINVQVNMPETAAVRNFLVPDGRQTPLPQQVTVVKVPAARESVGNPPDPWRSRRLIRASLAQLQDQKEFVQYGGPTGRGRVEALSDIRWLLDKHGKAGAWLWDPFLGSKDVLNTLFFCRYVNADLRALTSGKEPSFNKRPPRAVSRPVRWLRQASKNAERMLTTGWIGRFLAPEPVPSWPSVERQSIEASKGNCEGLRLEFRIRQGNAGWPFHDRFLIFPGFEPGQAKAWSLGTSVNSLGRQHHILQKVPDGELIKLAFLDLWDTLEAPRHLVWKTP